jgi:hypothetical protein
VGFDGVFDIVRSSKTPGGEMDRVPHEDISNQDLANTLLEVHRTLMALNESNRAIFKNVVRFLEKEIHDPKKAHEAYP